MLISHNVLLFTNTRLTIPITSDKRVFIVELLVFLLVERRSDMFGNVNHRRGYVGDMWRPNVLKAQIDNFSYSHSEELRGVA